MDLDAIESARSLLLAETKELGAVGRLWRAHAAAHLAEAIDLELRGGVRRLTGEDQARALLMRAGHDLQEAATALYAAAERLRSLGQGVHANRAYMAAKAAARAAEALGAASTI